MSLQCVTPIPLVAAHQTHGFGGDAGCVPCNVLRAATRGVLARWERRPRSTGPDEVHELLDVLATSIHQACLDATPAAPAAPAAPPAAATAQVDQRIHSLFGRRLLELLRHEVIAGWREGGAPDSELLPLLIGMERVRVAIEPNWAQTFAQHLSGADGLALLVDVAHDLRSPLTSILVLAETLERGHTGPVNDAQRRQLALIYTAALGLSSVASDIIEFTQGGEQLVEQEPVAFSVSAMLESVLDIVRPIAEEKRLTVRLLAPANDERMGHPVALSRILLNLTTNALKFTDEGYVEIVAQEVGGPRLEFAVRDSGGGIPPEKITTLFQPLRKEPGRRGQLFSRAGLGLTICRRLASALKSELKVESRIGWGTRFFFEVDVPICPARRSGARARQNGVRGVRPSGGNPTTARISAINGKRISGPTPEPPRAS